MNNGGRLYGRKAGKKTAWYLDVLLPGAEGQMDYHFHGRRGYTVHNSGHADRGLWHEGIRGFAYGQFAEPGLLVGHGC